MKRFLAAYLASAVLSTLLIVGCAPTAEGGTDPTPSVATSTETKSPETKASETKAPEEKASEAKTETAAAETEKPKDGDDVGVIETGMGRIVVMFYPSKAPNHVKNFMDLAKANFYDGTRWHRCIDGFMIQGGDPNSKNLDESSSWGQGGNKKDGKEINVKAEFNDVKHVRGVLSMARSQSPDSASSQFFIMQGDNPGLDGQYSAFGKAIAGMDVVDKIVKTGDAANNGAVDPKAAVLIKSIRIVKWPIKG